MEPPSYLAKKNSHERDSRIVFFEGPHIYEIDGQQGFTSVTTWNHTHFSSFNSDEIIDNMIKKGKLNDPNHKYYRKTREEILEIWDKNRIEASSAGTKMHYNIECFYNNMDVSDTSIEYEYFMKFRNDNLNLEAYRTEWNVFHEEMKLSGSIDMLYKDTNNEEFYIYDWKRSKGIEFESGFGKTSTTKCIKHIPDTNFWHYSLQLNVYRKILFEKYNIKVTKLCLVVLHPENSSKTYDIIEVPFMDEELEKLWDFRKQQLTA
jgi:hypothetical protein